MIEYNRPQLGSKLVIRFENCTHRGPLRVNSVDRADPLTGTNISAWVYMTIFSPVSEMKKG